MKPTLIIAAATLLFASGQALAGGGCAYGHAAKVAASEAGEKRIAKEATDPKLLAQLKQREAQKNEAPPIHN